MSSPLSKLPPSVRRELLRHVKPSVKNSSNNKPQQEQSGYSMTNIVLGCVGFVTVMGSVPLAAHYYMSGLTEKDSPLTAAQVRRGAFLNSGSKDVGKDPNWDFEHGRFIKPASDIEESDDLHDEHYVIRGDVKDDQEEKLRAFALGRRTQDGSVIVPRK